MGASSLRYADQKHGIDAMDDVTVLAPVTDGPVPIDWERADRVPVSVADLEQAPADAAQYLPVPAIAAKANSYPDWTKAFAAALFRSEKVELFKSPSSQEISKPGESERDFRLRLVQSGREHRDRAAERLRLKYAPKIAALQERIRRAEHRKARQQTEARQSQLQAAISVGASILGAFLGRKTISATNIGRATTAVRSAGRVIKESQDVGQAEETLAVLQQQLTDLEAQFQSESGLLAASADPLSERLERLTLRPAKGTIAVKLLALAWAPHWRGETGDLVAAWR
jgi:hypothetical protein